MVVHRCFLVDVKPLYGVQVNALFSGTIEFPWCPVCCRMYAGVLLGVVCIWRFGRRVGRIFCVR